MRATYNDIDRGSAGDPTLSDAFTVLKSLTKPQLRKGMSYVLKTMQLDSALATAKLAPHVDLNYWQPQVGESILQAFYWLANDKVGHDPIYVRAGCVPSRQRSEAAAALTNEGLPCFVAWVRSLVAQPANFVVRNQQPFFDATSGADGLHVHYTPSQLIS